MNETLPIVTSEEAKQLREMARKVRFISARAASDRTRQVLQAMAEEYERRAAHLESRKTSGPDAAS